VLTYDWKTGLIKIDWDRSESKGKMTKHRFFIAPHQVEGNTITINGADVNHIRNVLRLKSGDKIVLSDNEDFEYDVRITRSNSSQIETEILKRRPIETPNCRITLLQSISKGSKMDMIVRQATELGANSIVPMITTRTVVKLDKEKKAKKQQRWQKIAREAAEQSQRTTITEILPITKWDEMLKMIPSFDQVIVFWEETDKLLSKEALCIGEWMQECQDNKDRSYAVMIGPEGGFSPEEINDLEEQGANCFSLGRQILRTETASVVALGIILYELERFGDRRV